MGIWVHQNIPTFVPAYFMDVNGKHWNTLGNKKPASHFWLRVSWSLLEALGLLNGAEGRNRTGTGVAHCALNTACLPIPPLRQF